MTYQMTFVYNECDKRYFRVRGVGWILSHDLKVLVLFYTYGLVCFTNAHLPACLRALPQPPPPREPLSGVQPCSSKHSPSDSACCSVFLFRLYICGVEPGLGLLSRIPGKAKPSMELYLAEAVCSLPPPSLYPEYILILRRFLLGCFHTVGGRKSTPDWGDS